MSVLSRTSRPILVAAIAIIVGLTLLAALQLGSEQSSVAAPKRKALASDWQAADHTVETGAEETNVIRMDRIDRIAAEKLGEKPRPTSREELARLTADTSGTDALKRARHVNEILRTQGSAAALAALRSAPKAAP